MADVESLVFAVKTPTLESPSLEEHWSDMYVPFAPTPKPEIGTPSGGAHMTAQELSERLSVVTARQFESALNHACREHWIVALADSIRISRDSPR